MEKLTTEELSFILGSLNQTYNNAVSELNNNNGTMGDIQIMIYKQEEKRSLELIIKLEGILDKL